MRHLDPDDLALLALGEDVDGADHLSECELCADEVASLARVVELGRTISWEDVPLAPQPDVWERISTELRLGASGPGAGADVASDDPGPRMEPRPTAGEGGATVHSLAARRRPLTGWIAGAAAAGVLVGAVGGAWWSGRPHVPASSSTVLAEAALDPLPGWEAAAGSAVVRETDEGDRVVVLDVAAPEEADGYREVWLIASDLSGMVSLGLLEGAEGEFAIPDGLDLDAYPVVDVSEEPFDGDATHSGNSIVRGTLGA